MNDVTSELSYENWTLKNIHYISDGFNTIPSKNNLEKKNVCIVGFSFRIQSIKLKMTWPQKLGYIVSSETGLHCILTQETER